MQKSCCIRTKKKNSNLRFYNKKLIIFSLLFVITANEELTKLEKTYKVSTMVGRNNAKIHLLAFQFNNKVR